MNEQVYIFISAVEFMFAIFGGLSLLGLLLHLRKCTVMDECYCAKFTSTIDTMVNWAKYFIL